MKGPSLWWAAQGLVLMCCLPPPTASQVQRPRGLAAVQEEGLSP